MNNDMKKLIFLAAIVVAIMTACSNDSSEQEWALSDATTPVEFNLGKKGIHFLFDYAGSRLVGADTINVEHAVLKEQKITLRQGRHRLLWMRGLNETAVGGSAKGVDYNPATGMVTCQSGASFYPKPQYCMKELEVTASLLPMQSVEYASLCGEFFIILDSPSSDYMVTFKNIPFVTAVSVEGSQCEKIYTQRTAPFYGQNGKWTCQSGSEMLCPKAGLNDVQLEYEVKKDGVLITALQLPKFSIQRGYCTYIRGPLIGGSASDFTVTMESTSLGW